MPQCDEQGSAACITVISYIKIKSITLQVKASEKSCLSVEFILYQEDYCPFFSYFLHQKQRHKCDLDFFRVFAEI